jgi:predicted transcriptional regulator
VSRPTVRLAPPGSVEFRVMNPSRMSTDSVLASCLQDGEKSLREIFALCRLNFSTIQKGMTRMLNVGMVERRWVADGAHRSYVYKLKV